MFRVAWPLFAVAVGAGDPVPLPVLKHSDVVFMYGASADVYRAYGGTVLAWGGTPTTEAIATAHGAGVSYFGSAGMVTEFARVIDDYPDYERAICLDVEGNRLKVPWLWDHQHKGVPAYWFCTNQPLFRDYMRRRVVETVQAGADGVHIDDHLGTAGNSWLGGCYCDQCLAGFRDHLAANAPAGELADAGVADLEGLDYRGLVLAFIAEHPDAKERLWQRPLARHFATYQSRQAAAFMMELRQLAAETAGHPVPMSANAGVPSIAHLSDYQALDFLSCEVDQKAGELAPHDGVAFAYKMAEALGRPVAGTASGWDWSLINDKRLSGLVRLWVAQAYALGHFFMTPHRQWCYTQEKGTHWYDGPTEDYAWLFRAVRDHAPLLDGYETVADLGLVVAARAYRDGEREVEEAAVALTRANIAYRLLLAGDDALTCSLSAEELRSAKTLVVTHREALTDADRAALDARAIDGGVVEWQGAEALLAALSRPIRVRGGTSVWAVPRANPADENLPRVIHLVNRDYDATTDAVVPVAGLSLEIEPAIFGCEGFGRAVLHPMAPAGEPRELVVTTAGDAATVIVPELGMWAILELTPGRT